MPRTANRSNFGQISRKKPNRFVSPFRYTSNFPIQHILRYLGLAGREPLALVSLRLVSDPFSDEAPSQNSSISAPLDYIRCRRLGPVTSTATPGKLQQVSSFRLLALTPSTGKWRPDVLPTFGRATSPSLLLLAAGFIAAPSTSVDRDIPGCALARSGTESWAGPRMPSTH